MKPLLLTICILAISASSYADMLGINIELSRTQGEPTLVSLRCGFLTGSNRDNVPIQTAAKTLRDIKFFQDAKFAVIHSKDQIPLKDLMPIFEAMSANDIGIYYIQIGNGPPTSMDIWNKK